jgi:sphinganine-1-phosphate aldolase
VGASKRIEAAVRKEIPELGIMGSPLASVVAFKSVDAAVNIHAVGDAMSARGWHLNALTDPPGLHIACTVSSTSFSPRETQVIPMFFLPSIVYKFTSC